MQIHKTMDYNDMSRKAANIISAQVILKPKAVLGLATGSSPLGTYRQLIDWYYKGDVDFSGITTINLDEYRGIAPDNAQSYRYFMFSNFFNHINIDPNNVNIPNGLEEDIQKECARYNAVIENAGGIDLQLLGLGHNGHIGFNEPNDVFEKDTHCIKLTQSTIEANKHFFENEKDMPREAYTMGIRSIMRARKILIIVSGKDKAEIVREAFWGPVTPRVPASVLQLHADVTVVADNDALSLINI